MFGSFESKKKEKLKEELKEELKKELKKELKNYVENEFTINTKELINEFQKLKDENKALKDTLRRYNIVMENVRLPKDVNGIITEFMHDDFVDEWKFVSKRTLGQNEPCLGVEYNGTCVGGFTRDGINRWLHYI